MIEDFKRIATSDGLLSIAGFGSLLSGGYHTKHSHQSVSIINSFVKRNMALPLWSLLSHYSLCLVLVFMAEERMTGYPSECTPG